jgi:FtsP/CotA-like multicopper oxidase with cupredoxin domain
MDVDRRTYRVRILNGSNARIYKLAWSDGTPMTVIGGDGGLLERARAMKTLTLATGQRADLLLELSDRVAGTSLRLNSVSYPSDAVGRVGMMGETSPMPQVPRSPDDPAFQCRPSLRPGTLSAPPDQWAGGRRARASGALMFRQMNWLLGGRTFDMADVAPEETIAPGSTHIWEFVNRPNPMGMAMAHPIHLHGPQFRVLSRSGASGNALSEGVNDTLATDTVLVLPGETVRTQVTFSRFPGLYLYHCHILEHEDMGMMRNFRIA